MTKYCKISENSAEKCQNLIIVLLQVVVVLGKYLSVIRNYDNYDNYIISGNSDEGDQKGGNDF